MKTIALAIFEGVASKNILRTEILATLLRRPDIRLVLLTKSGERIAYHRKEFDNLRILYEAVQLSRPSGIDAFFARLKFLLLRTETTRLRQRGQSSLLRFRIWDVVNWLVARPSVRRLVRALDWWLAGDPRYDAFFAKYRPDLVVAANLFEEAEMHLVREARRSGIATIGFINSWDKTTARAALRFLPDCLIVFNQYVCDELVAYHDADRGSIFIGGIPQYDQYLRAVPTPRDIFCKKIGIDPRRRIVVYSPLGGTFWRSDWDMIDFLHRLIDEGKMGDDAALFVRFPPNEFVDEHEIASRPFLRYDYPGVRFSETRGSDWDMTFPELAHLADTLFHMSLLICYASSISVDAAMLNRPVININFTLGEDGRFGGVRPSELYGMTHYRAALASGGIRLVGSVEELIAWAGQYLARPGLDREGRARLAREQCWILDGKAGERIGKFILDQV